jgi:hypothetical protein
VVLRLTKLIQHADEFFELCLVTSGVFLSEMFVALHIRARYLLPDLANFFHDVKRSDLRHLSRHSVSCLKIISKGTGLTHLSDEEHIGREGLFGHLIEQRIILPLAKLNELLSKPILVYRIKDIVNGRAYLSWQLLCIFAFVPW